MSAAQYIDTGWLGVFFTLVLVFFILFNIIRAEKGKKELFIRRIAGLNAIDDAIGRATEMGRPILMVPGIGDLDAVSVQAVNVFAQVTKTAAQFGTPIKLCCARATVYAVAQEVIRDVYYQQGLGDRYSVDSVQFVSDQQFAFAAGVSGIILREKVAAAFLLGAFYAESLIFAETCNSVGAIQVAGSTQSTQTPFFIAACDYVLIGDEYYAASAYLTRQPVLVGSLVGQDWCKILMAVTIFSGMLMNSAQKFQTVDAHMSYNANGTAELVPIEGGETEPMANADRITHRLFNPAVPPAMFEEAAARRPLRAQDDAEVAPEGDGE